MDEMLTTILKEIQQLSSKMSEMEKRFDGIENRLDIIEHRLDNIETNMATKDDIARVEEKITEQKLRIDYLENQEFTLKVVRRDKQ